MQYHVSFRPLTLADLQHKDNTMFFQQIWPKRHADAKKDTLESLTTQNTDRIFAILVDGVFAGITGHYQYDAHSAGIDWHGVLPKYQGRGVGRVAFEHVLQDLRQTRPQVKRIVELVPADRPYVAKYFQCFGFRVTSEASPKQWNVESTKWVVYELMLD